MGRPRTEIGTYGTITVTGDEPPFEASTYFRDMDGDLRRVRARGRTKASAEKALKKACADRQRSAGLDIRPDMTVADLADRWLERVERSDRAVGTKQQYRRTAEANVIPALGKLLVREVRPRVADAALQRIRDRHGYAVAKSARSVMSGMFGLAVRQDALPANPVREVERLTRTEAKKQPRALTVAETDDLTDLLRTIERSADLDLPDLADFMLMTGCRIGEALACRDGRNSDGAPLLDLDAGTWEINATVIRVKGEGLMVQEHPKTEKGWRIVALPPAAVELLRRRMGQERLWPRTINVLDASGKVRPSTDRIVFPSPAARTLRDPSNCEGDLREVLDRIACPACNNTGKKIGPDGQFVLNAKGRRVRCATGPWSWVTSHVFRKTVATRMEEAGCTPRQVADQLGHSKVSMTQDVYFGRAVVVAEAAAILDR